MPALLEVDPPRRTLDGDSIYAGRGLSEAGTFATSEVDMDRRASGSHGQLHPITGMPTFGGSPSGRNPKHISSTSAPPDHGRLKHPTNSGFRMAAPPATPSP